jgi:hypothetical protein
VEVADIGGPLLLGDDHYIYVTSLCAGFKTSLSLITLGIVLGVYFLEESKKQLAFSLFICYAPPAPPAPPPPAPHR